MKKHLSRLALSNFKSFKSQNIDLAPLTLLTGLNNSGKSSILQAIRIFYRWSSSQDPSLPGHGSLEKLKNIHSGKNEAIRIACSFNGEKDVKMELSFRKEDCIEVKPSPKSVSKLPVLNFITADRLGPSVKLPIHTGIENLKHVGEHGEFTIDFLSRYEDSILPEILQHSNAEGKTLLFNVRAWLEEISPGIDFKHQRDEKRDMSYLMVDDFRATNVGFGISYSLPVIVSLLGMASRWENGALILLENPEAHLHPKAQTFIGQLIARSAQAGAQLIVETHSDHLLDGIRIAVKKNILAHDMVKLYYCGIEGSRNSKLETPNISQDGKIDFWPEGFFDQTMKNRAILARQ